MHTSKQTSQIHVFILLFIIAPFARTATARSVYAISNHNTSIISAYDINGVGIDYQTTAQRLPPASMYDLTVRRLEFSQVTDTYSMPFEVVPEPSTIALLTLGFIGIILNRKQRVRRVK